MGQEEAKRIVFTSYGENTEQLRMLFSLFLPPFYAPAFAQLVHESNSIGLGISFAIVINLGLVSCFVKYRSQHEFFPQWCWFFPKRYLQQYMIRLNRRIPERYELFRVDLRSTTTPD